MGLGSTRFTQGVKNKIRNTLKGRTNPKKYVRFAQYTLMAEYLKTFNSGTEVKSALNLNTSNLSRVCGKGLSFGGYTWVRLGKKESAPIKIQTRFDNDGNVIISTETRKKISLAGTGRNLGKKTSDETKLKQRLARLGKPPANKGIPQTDHQRFINKISSTNSKPVMQFSMDGAFVKEWYSVKEATEHFTKSGSRTNITNAIMGKFNQAWGYKWQYKSRFAVCE